MELIKMRTNKDEIISCNCCGNDRKHSLEMFDIRFGNKYGNGVVVTLCDACNEKLFDKSLKAVCKVNGKLKSQRDLAIIRQRRDGKVNIHERGINDESD